MCSWKQILKWSGHLVKWPALSLAMSILIKLKKTWILKRAPFENISWSAAARIAATTLPVLNRLPEAQGRKLPSVGRIGLALNILQKFTDLSHMQLYYNISIKNSRKRYLINPQWSTSFWIFKSTGNWTLHCGPWIAKQMSSFVQLYLLQIIARATIRETHPTRNSVHCPLLFIGCVLNTKIVYTTAEKLTFEAFYWPSNAARCY